MKKNFSRIHNKIYIWDWKKNWLRIKGGVDGEKKLETFLFWSALLLLKFIEIYFNCIYLLFQIFLHDWSNVNVRIMPHILVTDYYN